METTEKSRILKVKDEDVYIGVVDYINTVCHRRDVQAGKIVYLIDIAFGKGNIKTSRDNESMRIELSDEVDETIADTVRNMIKTHEVKH